MTTAVPTLTTERLILRPLSMEYKSDYHKHFVDYEVIRHLSASVPWPYPENGVQAYLHMILPEQGRKRWDWGLFLKSHPKELIGSIGLWREGCPEHRGFWLGRAFWGQGLMTEAAWAVTDYAFSHLGYEILVFSNAAGNLRSRRVKEKTGAHLIGVRPSAHVDPALSESETWELSKTDWEKFRNSRWV